MIKFTNVTRLLTLAIPSLVLPPQTGKTQAQRSQGLQFFVMSHFFNVLAFVNEMAPLAIPAGYLSLISFPSHITGDPITGLRSIFARIFARFTFPILK